MYLLRECGSGDDGTDFEGVGRWEMVPNLRRGKSLFVVIAVAGAGRKAMI